jgi:3-hydroxyacyl-CoA dehydrogenase
MTMPRRAETQSVIVVIGAGQIGQAIARRVAVGKHVLLADLRITGSDILMDGGVTAAYLYGDLAEVRS